MDERHINDKEIWKDIPGFEGMYQASTFCRIRSVDSVKKCISRYGKEYKYVRKGKVLKPYKQARGYMTVTLYRDGIEEFWFVHRLVAITFLENTFHHKIVSFIDGDKYNLKLDNLQWGSCKTS